MSKIDLEKKITIEFKLGHVIVLRNYFVNECKINHIRHLGFNLFQEALMKEEIALIEEEKENEINKKPIAFSSKLKTPKD